jgi:hypothetical protein
VSVTPLTQLPIQRDDKSVYVLLAIGGKKLYFQKKQTNKNNKQRNMKGYGTCLNWRTILKIWKNLQLGIL